MIEICQKTKQKVVTVLYKVPTKEKFKKKKLCKNLQLLFFLSLVSQGFLVNWHVTRYSFQMLACAHNPARKANYST